MRKYLLALALALLPLFALGQASPAPLPPQAGHSGQFLKTNGSKASWATVSGGGGSPGGTSGQVQFNNAGAFGGFTVSGDGTLNTGTGALTITKTGGVNFASSATVDTTNAANITSGALGTGRFPVLTGLLLDTAGTASAYGGTSCTNQFPRSLNASGVATCASVANTDLTNSSVTVAGHSVALGGSTTIACGDLSNAGTACTATAPSGSIVGTTDTQTMSAKRITKRVTSLSSSSTSPTFTISGDTTDIVNISATGSTGTVTFAAPSPSTPNDGDQLEIRITCTNAQTYAWNAVFTASSSLALPTAATGSSKTDKILFEYSSSASKWQLQATNFGF